MLDNTSRLFNFFSSFFFGELNNILNVNDKVCRVRDFNSSSSLSFFLLFHIYFKLIDMYTLQRPTNNVDNEITHSAI